MVQGTLAPSMCTFSCGLVRWPGEGSCVSTCSSLACWGDSSARPAFAVAPWKCPSVWRRAQSHACSPEPAASIHRQQPCLQGCMQRQPRQPAKVWPLYSCTLSVPAGSAEPRHQATFGIFTHRHDSCLQVAPRSGTRQLLASLLTCIASCFQGCGQAQAGLVNNWGDGFITDPAVLAAAPGASDPNPFFQSLMGKPYLNQVVIAPHVYPPSITNNPKLSASGPELYMRLSRWGQWSVWWPRQLVLACW